MPGALFPGSDLTTAATSSSETHGIGKLSLIPCGSPIRSVRLAWSAIGKNWPRKTASFSSNVSASVPSGSLSIGTLGAWAGT